MLYNRLPIVKSIKNRLVDKDKGQPCEQGETAASSGCIPASGVGGQKPSSQGQQSGGESNRQDYSEVEEDADTKQELKQVQSKLGMSRDQLYASVGVLPGKCVVNCEAIVWIEDDPNGVLVDVEHSDYHSVRSVFSDHVHNNSLEIYKTGQGTGLNVFALQVKTLSANPKMKYIETRAGGSGDGTLDKKRKNDMNGYYTWPRLGYDAPLSFKLLLSKPPEVRRLYDALEEAGIDPKSITKVSDLMKTKEGREAWYRYGFERDMKFDLAEGSLSRKILAEYIKESKAKHGTKMLTRLKSNDDGINDGNNDVEQPPEVQDNVLDSIWDRIGDEKDEVPVKSEKGLYNRLPITKKQQTAKSVVLKALDNVIAKEGRWITLNGGSEDGAGTHVYVSNGKITAGPSSLEGKPLSNLSGKKPKKPKTESKPAAKIPPKPKPIKKPIGSPLLPLANLPAKPKPSVKPSAKLPAKPGKVQPAKPQGNATTVNVKPEAKPEAPQVKPEVDQVGMQRHMLEGTDRKGQELIIASLNKDGAEKEAQRFVDHNKKSYDFLTKSEKEQLQQAIIDEVRAQAGKTGLGQDLSSIYDAVSKKMEVTKSEVLGALSVMHDNSQIRMSGWPKTVGEVPDLTMANFVSNKLMYYAGAPGGNAVNLRDVISSEAAEQTKPDSKPEATTKTSAPKPTGKTSGGSYDQMRAVIGSNSGNMGLRDSVLQPFVDELYGEMQKLIVSGFPSWSIKAAAAKKAVSRAISSRMKETIGEKKMKDFLESPALGLGFDVASYKNAYKIDDLSELCSSILVSKWADTSGDSDRVSCRIQEAAMEVFGLDEKSTHKNWKPALTKGATSLEKEVYKAFLQATYDHTQETLKKAGIKELVLYRGVGLDSKHFKSGKNVEMQTQPLSSFAYTYEVANEFAENTSAYGKEPRIIAAKVPIDRIFSLWTTGNGCMAEDEVVVIGGPGSCTLRDSEDKETDYWRKVG